MTNHIDSYHLQAINWAIVYKLVLYSNLLALAKIACMDPFHSPFLKLIVLISGIKNISNIFLPNHTPHGTIQISLHENFLVA